MSPKDRRLLLIAVVIVIGVFLTLLALNSLPVHPR